MSGIYQRALTAEALLSCDIRDCPAHWTSEPYDARGFRAQDDHVGPALALGWRVFIGHRSQHTYCPKHGPKTPMRLWKGQER